ncbi:tail-anchored protein insertion receptor [Microdochium nivale]|nr:tail-anchored protein insertion receptor [Microdochium nivale]
MATVSWATIRSLLLFFGPMLLPRLIRWYKDFRSGTNRHGLRVRPIPPQAFRAILLLVTVAGVLLVLALPAFAPENVFVITQSRLQIPTDTLYNRVSSLRPDNVLTDVDQALRAKFVSLESRLLYLQYGPDVLADCPFCSSDDIKSYFYYAVPSLLGRHLVNLVALSLATSEAVAGREGMQWRRYTTIAAAVGAAVDVYLVSNYNHQANARAPRLQELDMFFWTSRAYRSVALAGLDLVFAVLLFLSSTNRAFATPPSPAERIEAATRSLMATRSKLSAFGVLKNTSIRDEDLRSRTMAYWQHEGHLMREMMEDREVIEGVNDALENRINIQNITKDADVYVASLLPPEMDPVPEMVVG